MKKKKLLRLADLLEKDARRKKGIKFNMAFWGIVSDEEKPLSCGTEACAMGLAALSGEFRGLTAHISAIGYVHITVKDTGIFGGIDAAVEIFGLTRQEARWLFLPDYYDGVVPRFKEGERLVAKRIRNLVARTERPGNDVLG